MRRMFHFQVSPPAAEEERVGGRGGIPPLRAGVLGVGLLSARPAL